MKKWAFFMMLLITAAGTFFPCCPEDSCSTENSTSTSHDNHNKQEGNCSPFFSCTSCNGFVKLHQPVQLTQPEMNIDVQHREIIPLQLSAYTRVPFQPPRIALRACLV